MQQKVQARDRQHLSVTGEFSHREALLITCHEGKKKCLLTLTIYNPPWLRVSTVRSFNFHGNQKKRSKQVIFFFCIRSLFADTPSLLSRSKLAAVRNIGSAAERRAKRGPCTDDATCRLAARAP